MRADYSNVAGGGAALQQQHQQQHNHHNNFSNISLLDCSSNVDAFEDIFFADAGPWTSPVITQEQCQAIPGNVPGPPGLAKFRLNSYDSLNSPDSSRSRVSSGEDADLEAESDSGAVTINKHWGRQDSLATPPDDPDQTSSAVLELDPKWNSGLDEAMKSMVSLMPASATSATSAVVDHPSSVTTFNVIDDPSLTELNSIFDSGQRAGVYPTSQLLTPATTPGELESVEWTYLEPVQPYSISQPPSANQPSLAGQPPAHYEAQEANWSEAGPAVLVQPVWQTPQHHQLQPAQAADVAEVTTTIELVEPVSAMPTSASGHLVPMDDIKPPIIPPSQAPTTTKRAARAAKDAGSHLPRDCHVCGEPAGKHSYYGGQVCPSCRAFFRRSVQSKYSDVYKCSKGGNCTITLKTRKNCQFCRFSLCEKAGMKRSWVLADSEIKAKKAAKAANNQTGNGSNSSNNSKPCSSTNPASNIPTGSGGYLKPRAGSLLRPEDQLVIDDSVQKMQMVKHQTEDLNPQIMEEFIELVKKSNLQLSKESRKAMKKVLEQRSRLFALSLSEFTSLNNDDQILLLEENTGPLIELRIATFFHTEIKVRQQVDLILGKGDVLRLTASLADVHDLDNQHLEYEQFFTQRDEAVEAEDKVTAAASSSNNTGGSKDLVRVMDSHKSLLQKISRWVVDKTTFCLMNLILLFSTVNRKQLQQPEVVEAHQENYLRILHAYLASTHTASEARQMLAEGISVISHCRELHRLSQIRCEMRSKSDSVCSNTSSGSSGSGDEEQMA